MDYHCDKSARVGADVTVGYNSFIGKDVQIGDGCRIGVGVVIHDGTRVGSNVRIDDNTVLGKFPMKAANSATTKDQELSVLSVGDNCIIGTSVVLYRGAKIGKKVLIAARTAFVESKNMNFLAICTPARGINGSRPVQREIASLTYAATRIGVYGRRTLGAAKPVIFSSMAKIC